MGQKYIVYAQNQLELCYLLLRFLDGVGDAASWCAIISVMMKLYPDKVASILSWSEMAFGLGYSLGPAIGGLLNDVWGFKLPFLLIGAIAFCLAVALVFLIPGLKINDYGKYLL